MTAIIIPEITTLAQHIFRLSADLSYYLPDFCNNCGHFKLWFHGFYYRKCIRANENRTDKLENPIPIPRFRCPSCRKTCSALPECIAPRRWYRWKIQQAVLMACFLGTSLRQIEKKYRMSRSTIKRWYDHLESKFKEHAFFLKARFPFLGEHTDLTSFWLSCLHRMSLAKAHYYLHLAGSIIP